MTVADSEKAIEEEGEVRVFCESGKLPAAIFADINDPSNSRILQQTKELFGSLLGEADCEKG